MFGVLMSVQPLNPTSFQPRSSATIWTKLGLFSAAFARATAPNSASTPANAVAMRFCLDLTFIIVSFLCLLGRYFTSVWVLEAEFATLPRCGAVDREIASATNKLVFVVVDDLWLPEQLNTS